MSDFGRAAAAFLLVTAACDPAADRPRAEPREDSAIVEDRAADEDQAIDDERATEDDQRLREDWTAGIVEAPASAGATGSRTLRDVRWASHPGFERVTFEFEEPTAPAFRLEYIDSPVRKCGSGQPTPIAGDGWLEVRLRGTAAHTEAGEPTVAERESFPELEVLREVEITCDFEGEVVVVLGVASPNRYRTLVLEDPARLAVDIRR